MEPRAEELSWSRRSLLLGAGTIATAAPIVGLLGRSTGGTAAIAAAGRQAAMATVEARGGSRITLYAEKLAGGLYGYGLAPGEATIPGPLIELTEGETVLVDLVNNTDQTISLHAHGVDYDTASDGTPLNNGTVAPGATRTFTWRTHTPRRRGDGTWDAGSAGYWHYHDHAMGSSYGTTGIHQGLYGALIVRRRGDVRPHRQFVVVMKDDSINNLIWPNTPTFTARLGERVEWIVIGHDFAWHTFHLHGHRWSDTRTGYVSGRSDSAPVIDTKTVLPGLSFGFQVLAGEHVGPGAWMYHCHVQMHADAGMAGLFLVTDADGNLPPGAKESIARMRAMRVVPMPKSSGPATPGTTSTPKSSMPGMGH